MSIEETGIIDAIGIDRQSGSVVLTISDHLNWGEDIESEHLFLLQEKLNSYLRFIENGELHAVYPKAAGRSIVIQIVAKYLPSFEAEDFIAQASAVIEAAGYTLNFQTLRTVEDHGRHVLPRTH